MRPVAVMRRWRGRQAGPERAPAGREPARHDGLEPVPVPALVVRGPTVVAANAAARAFFGIPAATAALSLVEATREARLA